MHLVRGRSRLGRTSANELVLNEDTLRGAIVRLAVPAVIENLLMTAVYVANTMIIGWLRDETALAAVSIASVFMWTADALFTALGISATAIVARAWGAGNRERAERAAGQAILLSYLVSVLAVLLLYPNAEAYMRLMGAAPDVVVAGGAYLRWLIAFSLIGFPITVMNGIMRGAGDTRTPMLITLAMNVWNIIGTYGLVLGPAGWPSLGVSGAGLAGGSARAFGSLLALTILVSGLVRIRVPGWALRRWDRELLTLLVRLATPATGEYLIQRAGSLLFTRIISILGTVALAAHQVAVSMESLSFMPGFGLSLAASTLVGQALGARRPDLAERSVALAWRYAVATMGIVGVLFFTASRPLAQLYGATPDVVSLAALALRIGAFEQIGLASYMVLSGALRGAGDTRSPLWVSIGGIFLFRVPLVYLLAIVWGWGLAGVWIGTVIDWSGRAVIAAYFYLKGRWKEIEV